MRKISTIFTIALAAWSLSGCRTICELPPNLRLYPADSITVIHSNPWLDSKLERGHERSLFNAFDRHIKSVEAFSIHLNEKGDSIGAFSSFSEFDRHGLPLKNSYKDGGEPRGEEFLFQCDSSGAIRHFRETTLGGLGNGTFHEEYYNYTNGKLSCIGIPSTDHHGLRDYHVSYWNDGIIREASNEGETYEFDRVGLLVGIWGRRGRSSSFSLSTEYQYDSLGRMLAMIDHASLPGWSLIYTYSGDHIASITESDSEDPRKIVVMGRTLFQYDSAGLPARCRSFDMDSSMTGVGSYRFNFY